MKTRAGLTLLELVVVLGIIAIMSVSVVQSTRYNDRRNVHNAALTLQADLRYAQRRAIMEGRRVGIQFELAENRYHIIEARFTASAEPFDIIRTVQFENGVTLAHTNAPIPFFFLPRGTRTPGDAFNVALEGINRRNWRRITVTVGGGRAEIQSPP